MHYYSLNEYLKQNFGEKLYKISLSAVTTCPNRDGTLDTRGCIFCSGSGSGEFSADSILPIPQQIQMAKLRVAKKTDCRKFIAYFQPFTNTYGDTKYLKSVFMQAIHNDEVAVLSIATRPDCLGKDVLDLLAELNKIKPVWVELGLQTIHQKTAEYIRRCYPLEVYDRAVNDLHKIGINVITHIILGFPDETEQMMLETVKYVGQRTDGIKLQLLHILKGTDLQKDYEQGKFNALSLDKYIDILCKCIEFLPPNVVIHRLTGDGDKRLLVAPMWSANKKMVLNTINRIFRERNITQGALASSKI